MQDILASSGFEIVPSVLTGSEARDFSHRRVVHLEYATLPLPDGLAWAEAA